MKNAAWKRMVEKGILSSPQVERVLEVIGDSNTHFLTAALTLGYVNDQLLDMISSDSNIEYEGLPELIYDIDVARDFPRVLAESVGAIPISEEDGIVIVATINPYNKAGLESIKMKIQKKAKFILVSPMSFSQIMSTTYISDEVYEFENSNNTPDDSDNIESRIEGDPTVMLVNTVITDAYNKQASDIHIEPEEGETIIRYRVNGKLYTHRKIKGSIHTNIVSRIKVMSRIDSNPNKSHDGSFRFSNDFIESDVRVTTTPTSNGEKVVLRLLGSSRDISYNLDSLGIREDVLKEIRKILKHPNGIFIITGPTGSGKTTTLYSILDDLNSEDISIVTIEDPVEKNMRGITQIPVNEKSGVTFATAFRSILRQDPDIIMLGEMRDFETSNIAMSASGTGHFVLSTMHTNDAISSITRLLDLGAAPYMVKSTLRAVIAQRLVSVLCPDCKRIVSTTESQRELSRSDLSEAYIADGCHKCGNTGIVGRKAVFEIVRINSKIQKFISEENAEELIRNYVNNEVSITLRNEALKLVKDGVTSMDEAVKVMYTTEEVDEDGQD